MKQGAVLTKNIAPAIIKALANKYIDHQTLLDGLENASKAAAEILEKEIETYASRKKELSDFSHKNYLFPSVFLFSVFLKTLNYELYRIIRNKGISIQELSDRFSEILRHEI